MLVEEYLIIGWIGICVICIGLSVRDRKYLRVNVFIGHIGIRGLRLKLIGRRLIITVIWFSSVAQSCPTLCDPVDCSFPGLPVHYQLLESTQTQCPLSRWCHLTISSSVVPFSSRLQSVPESGSFQTSQLFASDGQSIGVSALASVLPMNIQDWFPLAWTGWISLQSKGLSRVFSNTTVQKHQFFSDQHSL